MRDDLPWPTWSARAPTAPSWLIACSFLALAWALLARATGPCDLWDQTQHRTVSYTTDILAHGSASGGLRHWILPDQAGTMPATKPPMYNWVAVPFVKLLGFSSEIAHKFPSIIALALCWLIIVRLGMRVNVALGWLAGLTLVANYPMFKLGYLARPDMLLTLWLLCAWVIATSALIRSSAPGSPASGWSIAAFWLFIALAGLTKGPAAIVGILYALVAARIIGGRWSVVRVFHPILGLPACALIIGLWIYGVWRINPEHLTHVLWHNEVFGRFTGTGPEGNKEGLVGWITTFPDLALYFVIRFVPWSVFSILAMIWLWRHRKGHRSHERDEHMPRAEASAWLYGAAIQVGLVVGLFTLSTSKRADYIAAAFPPGALLASWWLTAIGPRWVPRFPWLVASTALGAVALAALTIVNQFEPSAPARGFGNNMRTFVNRATDAIAADPMPVAFCWIDDTHLQAMFGASQPADKDAVLAVLERGEPFWVIAGRKTTAPNDFGEWFSTRRYVQSVQPVVRSAMMPRNEHWPEQVTLFKVVPTGSFAARPHPPETR